jgi:septal ring factor EnvC (AmiA/AmiB activator)
MNCKCLPERQIQWGANIMEKATRKTIVTEDKRKDGKFEKELKEMEELLLDVSLQFKSVEEMLDEMEEGIKDIEEQIEKLDDQLKEFEENSLPRLIAFKYEQPLEISKRDSS